MQWLKKYIYKKKSENRNEIVSFSEKCCCRTIGGNVRTVVPLDWNLIERWELVQSECEVGPTIREKSGNPKKSR